MEISCCCSYHSGLIFGPWTVWNSSSAHIEWKSFHILGLFSAIQKEFSKFIYAGHLHEEMFWIRGIKWRFPPKWRIIVIIIVIYILVIFSFPVFCVVRHFRLSLLNNFYCDNLHNIVIHILNSLKSENLKKAGMASRNIVSRTFEAIQSNFRYVLRCILSGAMNLYLFRVILGELESFRNYEGFSIIFPKILDAIGGITYESENFADSSLYHIFES